MKKTIFNASALKKALEKKELMYFEEQNKILAWSQNGLFALYIDKLLFNDEIIRNIPTRPAPDVPPVIKTIFNTFENANHLQDTKISITLNDGKTAKLYKNPDKNYIVPINIELTKIINDHDIFSAKQERKTNAILFYNAYTNIILMPLRDTDITKNLLDTVDGITA